MNSSDNYPTTVWMGGRHSRWIAGWEHGGWEDEWAGWEHGGWEALHLELGPESSALLFSFSARLALELGLQIITQQLRG